MGLCVLLVLLPFGRQQRLVLAARRLTYVPCCSQRLLLLWVSWACSLGTFAKSRAAA